MPDEPHLTAAWFRDLLAGDVASVRFEKIGTFSTELWRVYLDRDADPRTLVLKRAVAGRPERLGERFENEMRFYRELSHRIGARVPRYYGGGEDFLVVEDLGELSETNWLKGPSDEHARSAVAALARMHAAFFGQVSELEWIPAFADPGLLASFEEAYARNWPEWREFFCEVAPAFGEVGDALVGNIASSHAALAEEPTLLHGDSHAENIPLISGEVVLLDWAGPRRGNSGIDLGFFIPMSFPAERRPQVERSLVDHHSEVLREKGIAPGVDPWLAYRRGVLRRITRIIGSAHTWDIGTFASLRMIFHRCATAAVELRVADLA